MVTSFITHPQQVVNALYKLTVSFIFTGHCPFILAFAYEIKIALIAFSKLPFLYELDTAIYSAHNIYDRIQLALWTIFTQESK
jgi:hypothetical protein